MWLTYEEREWKDDHKIQDSDCLWEGDGYTIMKGHTVALTNTGSVPFLKPAGESKVVPFIFMLFYTDMYLYSVWYTHNKIFSKLTF